MNVNRASDLSLPDPASNVPLHLQVQRLIREQALNGDLVGRDGRLMTEAELGQRFGVSRITIRNAIRPLVEEGLLERTRGRGTFLRATGEQWGGRLMGFVEAGQVAGFRPSGQILRIGMVKVDDEATAEFFDERVVFELTRLRLADAEPVAIEQAFYPADIGLDLERLAQDRGDLGGVAIYQLLEEALGFTIAGSEQTIGACLADTVQAQALAVAQGSALIETERFTRDKDGRALELLRAVYVPERYRFTISLARSCAGTQPI